jgi:hypothetical protein
MFNMEHKWKSPIFVAGALFLALTQPAMVLAHTQWGYTPPPDRTRPQRTQGGGSRGCPNIKPVALQLLVPNDHTARTTQSHPTFAWSLSDVPSVPVQFTLTESKATQPILVKELPVKRSGIMQFTLPPDVSGLQVGKEYRWTVALVCNADRPSQNSYARAWIERVEPTARLTQILATAVSAETQAQGYAWEGFWYDALAALLNAPASSSDRTGVSQSVQSLLRQAGVLITVANK